MYYRGLTGILLATLLHAGVLPASASEGRSRAASTWELVKSRGTTEIDTDPAVVTLRRVGSFWSFDIDTDANLIIARSRLRPDIALEIDYDWAEDDGRYDGIAPVIGCQPLQGQFFYNQAPFIYPILVPGEHTTERLEVESRGYDLRVRFEGGAYELLKDGGGDDPLFMEATFRVTRYGGLTARLEGLQYLLPTVDDTRVTIHHDGGIDVRDVVYDPDTDLLEYFENAYLVEIDDPAFGPITFTSDIQRLQLQVHDEPLFAVDVFELDFDHTYKDRDQRVVNTEIWFEGTAGRPQTCE